MDFFEQSPPELGNQYVDDRVLRNYLKHTLSPERQSALEPDLQELGEAAGSWLYDLQLDEYAAEPVHTRYDAWGKRVDRIELTRVWQEAEPLAARYGLVARAYEEPSGATARVEQMALAYLFIPATDIFGCPLAMTDGAARALLEAKNDSLIDRAVPRLTSRSPEAFWTSGQWMTELPGGSDVSRTETVARPQDDGSWRLYGRKWFTSAVTAPMALALARPEGNDPGSKGLALFYTELRDEQGNLQGVEVNRLKDKLGTRKLPTAELTLDGLPATPVAGLTGGVRAIAPMLNITRTWNAITAVALMRRGIALARDFARKREAFGAPLSKQPLHVDLLAELQATFEASFHLAFRTVELLGEHEAGDRDVSGLLRLLTPIAKLTTAHRGIRVASEVVEAFGGNGYVEDTGIPALLRDMQVLSIWEGTTNVLSLDVLRALEQTGGLDVLLNEIDRCLQQIRQEELQEVGSTIRAAMDSAAAWLKRADRKGTEAIQAGARRFALTLGDATALALLARQAQWQLDHDGDERPLAAALRFSKGGIDHIRYPGSSVRTSALANDTPLSAATKK